MRRSDVSCAAQVDESDQSMRDGRFHRLQAPMNVSFLLSSMIVKGRLMPAANGF
jgi:hypothetical protein